MKPVRYLRLLATVSTLGLGLAALPALAAEAAAADAVGANGAAVGDSDQGALREIIVTAQRRSENIQSVPVAVTALDARALESATVNDIRDIAGRVPSLVVDSVSAGPSAAAISLRGISFEDIEKSFDPAVGVVVDGVFIGTNTGQLLDSFDLERLEVLRGPQGTLFGRNTIGGVINVTRTKPTQEAGARALFSYASYDTRRGRVVVNSGTLGGIISLKAFGFYDETGGYVWNAIQKRHDGHYRTLTGGLTALIEPSSNFKAEITYEHMQERGETVSIAQSKSSEVICLAAGAPGFSPANECNRFLADDNRGLYTTFETAPRDVRNDTDAITANLQATLSDSITLYSVTGYRKNNEDVRQDFDGSSADFFATRRQQNYKQFSQELRVVADVNDQINLLVGAYYFDSSYTLNQSTAFGPALGGPFTLGQYVDHKGKSYAGFTDVQFRLTDALKISLGARYTEDKKTIFNNYGQVGALVKLTVPTFSGVECVRATGTFSPAPGVTLPTYAAATNCSGEASFGKFTWRANAQYTIEPGKMVYLSYSKGFRSGGFNGRAASPTSLGPYQPETVDAYEGGLKADWLDRKLRTNLALYYTKYNNKQEEVVQPAPVGSANPQETVVKNASSATIKGVELEAIAQLSDALSFNASFSYTDAKYNQFFNDIVGLTTGSAADGVADNVSTLNLRRAPKFQWSAGLTYSKETASGRIDASTLLRFQSKYATCIVPNRPIIPGAVTNDTRCVTRDRENLNAQIGYTYFLGNGKELSFSVFGRNLTNKRDLGSTLPVAGLFTFSSAIEPRVIGAEVGFKF